MMTSDEFRNGFGFCKDIKGYILFTVKVPEAMYKDLQALPEQVYYKTRLGPESHRLYMCGLVPNCSVGRVEGHHLTYVSGIALPSWHEVAVEQSEIYMHNAYSNLTQPSTTGFVGSKLSQIEVVNWPSRFESEEDPYVCVALRVQMPKDMLKARDYIKGKLLPCFDAFSSTAMFAPHITIAYVRPEHVGTVNTIIEKYKQEPIFITDVVFTVR